MSRPTKAGLDYFPLDVGFLRDDKVRLLRAEFGASSVVFVLYVFCKVFEGDGYFLKWDKDMQLLAADDLKESPTYISEVLDGCLSRSIFDGRVFQMFGILTSAGIQRRYLRGCEKRDEIRIAIEYWLLDEGNGKDVPASIRAKLTLFEVSGGKKEVISPGNSDKSPGNPESKVKQSKGKESKDIGTPRKRFVPPTYDEVAAYCKSRNSPVDPRRFYDYFEAGNWVDSKGQPVRNWKQKLITWESRNGGQQNGRAEKPDTADAGHWNLQCTRLE